MFGSKIKTLPIGLLHALRCGLDKLKAIDGLPSGQHRIRGRAVVEIDCWLRKGVQTSARLPVPKIAVLSLALERAGLDSVDLAKLIDKAAFEVTEGLEAKSPTVDRALDAVRALMPIKDREGACVYTGQAKIVSFDET